MAFINGKKVLSIVKKGGITPTGTKNITTNGSHDVTAYAVANVNVDTKLPEQEKSATPTETTQEVTPDSGYTLSKVTVNPIPSEYIIPSGTKNITSNGTHNINEYESVYVNVSTAKPEQEKTVTPTTNIQAVLPDDGYTLSLVTVNAIPSKYVVPIGILDITSNGLYDVTNYAAVNADLDPTLQEKSATPSRSSQEIIADSDYDGLSKVTVEPIPSEYIIPKDTKEITENGLHYIQEYAAVNVNVVFDESSLIFAYYGEGV